MLLDACKQVYKEKERIDNTCTADIIYSTKQSLNDVKV